mgnify:CR=1 FL=1
MTMRVYLAGLAYFAVYVLATELHRWLRIRGVVTKERKNGVRPPAGATAPHQRG